jgi:hypothetical protein
MPMSFASNNFNEFLFDDYSLAEALEAQTQGFQNGTMSTFPAASLRPSDLPQIFSKLSSPLHSQ